MAKRLAGHFVLFAVISIAFILAAPGVLRAEFDYSKYHDASFEEIDRIVRDVAEEHKGSKGVDFFASFFATRVRLAKLPEPMDGAAGKSLRFWNNATKAAPPEYVKLFTHSLELTRGDLKYVLYFQENLIPYLQKEAGAGDEIKIYCVLIMYNEDRATAFMLVNEFQTHGAEGPQE